MVSCFAMSSPSSLSPPLSADESFFKKNKKEQDSLHLSSLKKIWTLFSLCLSRVGQAMENMHTGFRVIYISRRRVFRV